MMEFNEEINPQVTIHRFSVNNPEATLSPFDQMEANQDKLSKHSIPLLDPQFIFMFFKIFNIVSSALLVLALLAAYFNRALKPTKIDPYYSYIMTLQYNSTKQESLDDDFSYNITSYYYAMATDSYAMIMLIFSMILLVLVFAYFILTSSETFFMHLYNNSLAKWLPFTFILILFPFCLPFVVAFGDGLTIACLTLYSLSFLITLLMYFNTRNEKLVSYKIMIVQNILLSLLLSFQLYYILYCVCSLAYDNNGRKLTPSENESNLVVFLSVLYFCFGMALLTTYKDIIFSLVIVVIDLGILLSVSGKSFNETITMFVLVLFMFGGDVLFVFKFKADLFMYDDLKIEMETRLTASKENLEIQLEL